jgi:hypothetical protein
MLQNGARRLVKNGPPRTHYSLPAVTSFVAASLAKRG